MKLAHRLPGLILLFAVFPGLSVCHASDDQLRPAHNDDELRAWLENMVWHHRYSTAEIEQVTGLNEAHLKERLQHFNISDSNRPPRPDNEILMLPYPGGRHPRIGFLEGAVEPQRETKLSVFCPWDDHSYVVMDVPEAIWSNLGLTYLAHTHVKTIWDASDTQLEKLEWKRPADGGYEMQRLLPNGIEFATIARAARDHIDLDMWLRNGTTETLSDLRVQNCVMLKAAEGFNQQTNDNKLFIDGYAVAKSPDETHWIISGWNPVHRPWGNAPCPCLHSDPKFPDCGPGETQRLRGWFSFYQGEDIEKELKRIEATGWRNEAPKVASEAIHSNATAGALQRAGANRKEIEQALEDVLPEQRDGLVFLVENMPDRDLESLSAEFLLENSAVAWKALNETAWAKDVPQDIVFDCLLPYANVSEKRDRWRKDFYSRFRPLVTDAATPSEAAAILNQSISPTLNVKYSTGRRKADQSPFESMESGLASCTGLSVILVDACRSVGVPARIVGTPLWSDKSGNHTWVEIWDNGWHFTGACEPTGNKLDDAWFIDRASHARRDDRRHAIYAVTFRKNGQPLPMVWARDVHDVFAVNVTDRYTGLRKEIPEGHAIVRFRTTLEDSGKRVSVPLAVKDAIGNTVFEGTTNDERFDANDHLSTMLPIESELTAELELNGSKVTESFTVRSGEQLVSISVGSKK